MNNMKNILITFVSLAFVLSCTKPVSLPDYEFPPHLGGQETPKPNPEPGTGGGKEMTVRLCSYNVGTFSKSKSVLGHYSYPEVASLLKEIDADVVGLSETDRGNNRTDNQYQAAELAKAVGTGWTSYFAYAHNTTYGNSIVASPDYKVVKEWPRLLIPKGNGSENRSMGAVEYENFVFCVTHLDHISIDASKQGAEIITAWALENYGSGKTSKPVFLVGDMNCIPSETTITGFKKNWTLVSCMENTFPSDKPVKCIDDIFVLNNGVKFKAGETHAVTSSKATDVKLASDHCPMYCDVTFTIGK